MAGHGTGDGLLRWLLGGLAAGGLVLGLVAAAYSVGYDRGEREGESAALRAAAPAETEPAGTTAPEEDPVAQGERLFGELGCGGCHALGEQDGVGPGLAGIAGSTRPLADGTAAVADDAYLAESITAADAAVVEGYSPGVMTAAVAPLDLGARPADVAALVAFIKTL